MKTKLYIFALLILACGGMYAQPFYATTDNNAIQSQQLMPSGTNYEGAIYEPFDNTVPSEQSTVGASYSPGRASNGPRRGFEQPTNPGNQSNEFPLGDGVLPMLIMALAFGGAVYLRRRREA